ncbi:MAG TPA: hypothetical protein VI670_23120 [Thermoanaerobaculia bacterium]|jgi:hypothetical protein
MAETTAATTTPAAARSLLSRLGQRYTAWTYNEFILIDLFVSTVLGVAIWLTDRHEAGIITFFLALIVGLIVKLHSEMVKMLRDENETMKLITNVLELKNVDREILGAHGSSQYVTNILQGYATLLKHGDAWFLEHARFVFDQCSQDINRLVRGQIYHDAKPFNFYAILQDQLLATKHNAFFTSDVKTDFSWSDKEGKRYRELNVKRAKEGIVITRVFIVEHLSNITSEVRSLIEEQLVAGIHVKIVLASKLNDEEKRDMGIYDEIYVSQFDLTPQGHKIRHHWTTNTPEERTKAFEIRDRLLDKSEDARSVLDRHHRHHG